ncbi:MAG: hypothetical protein ACO25B_13185 [Chitinophagaceae bacterium]
MRGINYMAGFGTVVFIAGIYIIKAAFGKKTYKDGYTYPAVKYRFPLVAAGIALMVLGLLMIGRAAKFF